MVVKHGRYPQGTNPD